MSKSKELEKRLYLVNRSLIEYCIELGCKDRDELLIKADRNEFGVEISLNVLKLFRRRMILKKSLEAK